MKLRAMRQEQERIKAQYEGKSGLTQDAKRVRDLEDELQKTKTYYNKRIREIEEKYKYGKVPKNPLAEQAFVPKSGRSSSKTENGNDRSN